MTASIAEAKRGLLRALGAGTEDLYDEEGDVGLYFEGMARALKTTGFDLVDTLRKEITLPTMEQKVVDWEASCGLKETPTARSGTITQRRNQVLSKLRQHASFSLRDIRAALQPFLLYADPNQIQIVEPDRAALRTMHTYANLSRVVIPAMSTQALSVFVPDGPVVSPAGFQLTLTLSTDDLAQLSVGVVSPAGASVTFARGTLGMGKMTSLPLRLCSKALAGVGIYGPWSVQVTTGTVSCTVESTQLFVEALGRNYDGMGRDIGEGLGAAMFSFVVVVDSKLLGIGFDLKGAQLALKRMTPAHCGSSLLLPITGGGVCPFPDLPTTIPDISIPC